MDNLKKDRLEFLEEGIAYFTADPTRRSVGGAGCCYFPPHDNTQGCIIGRKIRPSLAKTLDGFDDPSVSQFEVFSCLPKRLQRLGQDFLGDCQHLHDENAYWDDKGLSELGLKKFEQIKAKIC